MSRRLTVQVTFHQSLCALCVCDVVFLTVVLAEKKFDMAKSITLFYPYFWHPMRNVVLKMICIILQFVTL